MKRIIVVLAAIGTVALAAPAFAHVTMNPASGPQEGRVTTFLRVGHGCETDGPNTVQLAIQIPQGVIGAVPEDEPGWTSEVKMTKLDEPLDTGEGDPLTEVPSEVTFSNSEGLDPHKFREFGLSLNIAASGEEVLYFPTVQKCQKGANRWVNIPATIEEWGDTEDPPPYLELTATEEETEEAGLTEDAVRSIAASEVAAMDMTPEKETDPMVWVAVALGALGLALGIAAFARSGRKA